MHDCRKVREGLSAAEDLEPFESELRFCPDCRQFADEISTMLKILDIAAPAVPELPPAYWQGADLRLRDTLGGVRAGYGMSTWGALAAASVLVFAVTGVGFRGTQLLVDEIKEGAETPYFAVVDDHIDGLDSGIVNFLGQSELFLRTFEKIEPADLDDIEDARARAGLQLVDFRERKEAAADFLPVELALDEYESVLREIKNLESSDEVAEIQKRIQRNGLIANFKVYQPRLVLTGGQ